MAVKLAKPSVGHDVSNLAVWGWEWRSGRSTFQIVAMRGVPDAPMLSVKLLGQDRWTTSRMHDKWHCDGTKSDFRRVVRDFVDSDS